uniref:MAK10-like protein n=1 Tax=Tanacetum cinerariifolium TaxID=118510 RepID=A0A6L2K5R2_TANCI|nr:MAK10-like protein [Tanacetum cinerariifolium]
MEAHLAPTQLTQVNKVKTSCEICSGPYDTQYCMEDPEQAFVEYASSRTDEAGGLVSDFMASQDARQSKFEADFKKQQSEMTKNINTLLKAITDRMMGALPSDTVKNLKLNASLVLSARSYLTEDPQCSTHVHGSINAITIHPEQQNDSYDDKENENDEEEKDNPKNTHDIPDGVKCPVTGKLESSKAFGWVECSLELGIQNVRNQNGLSIVPGVANQHGNGNVVSALAEGACEETERDNANCTLENNLQ